MIRRKLKVRVQLTVPQLTMPNNVNITIIFLDHFHDKQSEKNSRIEISPKKSYMGFRKLDQKINYNKLVNEIHESLHTVE